MGSHQETCLYVNFYCFPTSQYFWTMSILFLMPQNWNFKLWSNAYIFSVSLLNTSGSFQYCFRCSVSKNFSGGKTTQKCELKSLACVTIFICKMIKIVEISARFKTQTAISAGLWRQWQWQKINQSKKFLFQLMGDIATLKSNWAHQKCYENVKINNAGYQHAKSRSFDNNSHWEKAHW